MERSERRVRISVLGRSTSISKALYIGGLILTLLLGYVASQTLMSRLGQEMFLMSLIGVTVGIVYAFVSFRSIAIPFYVLILSVGLLRFIWAIKAPILPDLYFDRISLIWLTIVFMVMFFAKGNKLKKPWNLDVLVLAHGLYVLARVSMFDFYHFHTWTMSVMTPYAVYFFAKNIVNNKSQIHTLMVVLLVLGIYYNVTSIAEKYHITQLLYPKYMIEAHPEFIGRSTGPFRNSGIFGNVIGMLIPVHLYFIVRARGAVVKALLMLSMALGFAGLFFSYTRGSWLAGAAGLAAVLLLNQRQYMRQFLPLLILVPFFSLFFLGVGQDEFMKERVENDDTIGSRVGTAVTAMKMWRDHPFLGCGSFRYREFRENYIEPVTVPGLGTIRFVQFRNNSVHDMYLGPLAEDGMVGMVMLFSIYFLVLKTLWRKYGLRHQGDQFAKLVLPIFAGIVVAYLVGGMTISYRHTSILGVMFFLVAGIVSGYQSTDSSDTQPDDQLT